MRTLIVTADDVGLHPGMTEGAIRAHRDGIVTACSVVANGAAFEHAVERLRDVPGLEVGVHLTLVEEKPLTAKRFARKFTTFVPLYIARQISIGSIERELRAQIEKVAATGLRVTHLNGHQHLHLLPRIFALVLRLADDYGVPYVRIVNDHGGGPRPVSMAIVSDLGKRARREGRTNDRTIGVAAAGHLANVVPLLDLVEGVTELVTHPGVGVQGYEHWGYEWETETAAMCEPGLHGELEARGIRLAAPSVVAAGD